jgi:hypothetical protein
MARQEEEIHTTLTRIQIATIKNKGHTIIEADFPGSGYASPTPINGKVPDIVSKDPAGKKVITEVETCMTIGLSQTKEQFKAFSSARSATTEFHVLVPKSCLREAQSNASQWGIVADQWWFTDKY